MSKLPIGFLSTRPAKSAAVAATEEKQIFAFDNSQGIGIAAACYNTAVFGSTGAGKTSCAILPSADSLIGLGFGGLVIDVKGNVGDQVRALAVRHGRTQDVVEFGSSDIATPINILGGMTIAQVREFLSIVATFQFGSHTHNLDWHMKGVASAVDCVMLLRYLQNNDTRFQVKLCTLQEMLNNWPVAARLFDYFVANMHDKDDAEQRNFIDKIKSDQFNPMVFDKKKAVNNTYNEQTTWRITAIRNGLSEFLEHPGIVRNFATVESLLDVERLIYDETKIVLLRFDHTCGQVGAWLSRHILTDFYKAVYKRGMKLDKGRYTFFIGDEFQEICNFNPGNRYNDNAFAAKAREYNAIQIVGTQSVSSLISRGATVEAVLEYLNNINNRIVLYCDDSITQSMVDRYDPSVLLNLLKPGEAFVLRFDHSSRRHLHSVESFQQSHDVIQEVLRSVDLPKSTDPVSEISVPTSLSSLLEDFEKVKAAKIENKLQWGSRIKKLSSDNGSQPTMGDDMSFDKTDSEEKKVEMPAYMLALITEHPNVFDIKSRNLKDLIIPRGWVKHMEHAIKAMQTAGLTIEITGVHYHHGSLAISVSPRTSSMAVGIMTALLESAKELCPLCGNRIADDRQPACTECMSRFGLTAILAPASKDDQYF